MCACAPTAAYKKAAVTLILLYSIASVQNIERKIENRSKNVNVIN